MNILKLKRTRSLQRGTLFYFTSAIIMFISLMTATALASPPSVIISLPTDTITNNNTPALVYSVDTGTVTVKVDGITVSKMSEDNLDTLTDSTHTVRVEAVNDGGELGYAEVTFKVDTTSPTNTVYTKIAAGSSFVVALKSDGTLWSWGENIYGQLGDGTTAYRTLPVQVGSDNTWVSVAAGQYHSLAINKNGELWAWGYNAYGQLGINSTVSKYAPVRVGTDTTWIAISAGNKHSVALKNNGTLWTWGYNASGQLGNGSTSTKYIPGQVGSDTDWMQVASGGGHVVALKATGELFTWGYNAQGELGDGTTVNSSSPISIAPGTVWASISAGVYHSLATKTTGTAVDLYAWGQNTQGQLGDNTTTNRTRPVRIMASENLTSLAGGCYHTLAVKSNGTLWAWGYNYEGEVGDGAITIVKQPKQIGPAAIWSSVTGGMYHSAALRSDGTLWVWGLDIYGATNKSTPVLIGSDTSWASVSGGTLHSVGLKSDGTLWAWGYNFNGELGNGIAVDSSTPQLISAATMTAPWTEVAVGASHAIALGQNGTIWSWGYNDNGQLGDKTVTLRRAPVQVKITGGTDNDWVKIAAGAYFSLGMKTDGSIWAWGDNAYGELGDGTTTDRHAPTRVLAPTSKPNIVWRKIAVGAYHALAVDTDGLLWAWGNNAYGRLGDNTTVNKTSPVQIGSNTWTRIAGGQNFSLAIDTNSKLWSWGLNTNGQLGIGSLVNKAIPTQVGTANDWTMATGGYYQAVAVKQNGTLWAWGYNTYGEVGDGTTTQRTSPVQIGSEANWSFVDAGSYHSLALKQDRTLWAWGFGGYGQLGDGSAVTRLAPAQTQTPGNILINSGASYANNISVTLTLAATDANGISQMQFSNDGVTWTTAEPFASTKSWTLDSQEGVKTVSVMYKDMAGNWSQPFSTTIILDTTAPTVTISAPLSGPTRIIRPLLTYSASDGSIVVKVDGNIVSKVSGDTLDLLSEGSHTIRVDATDAAGNSGFDQKTIAVETVAPLIAISSPVAGFTNTIRPLLSYTVSKGTVVVKVDGNIVSKVSGDTLDTLTEGTHLIRVEATDEEGNLGTAEVSFMVDIAAPLGTMVSKVATGNDFTVIIASDGSLSAWGVNLSGQLGDGTDIYRYSPVQIGSAKDWVSVAAGASHTVALKSNGTLWAWGSNSQGQLGNGTKTNLNLPTQIGADRDWIAVAAGALHTLGLKSNGTLWAWGYNSSGQLGDGTAVTRLSPVQIGTDTDWAVITAGHYHSMALKSNKRLYGWGYNYYGGLGDTTTANQSSPELIGIDEWSSIAGGKYFSMGIKIDGTLWGWGYNKYGQLGNNSTANKLVPFSVGSDWAAVNTGACSFHVTGIKKDGSLWAWGYNASGQLGIGTTLDQSVPRQVGAGQNWAISSTGYTHTVAVDSSGGLWVWGNNNFGQLGNGVAVNKNRPVQIGKDMFWYTVDAGSYHSTASDYGMAWTWGRNNYSQIGDGTTTNRYSPFMIDSIWMTMAVSAGGDDTFLLPGDGSYWAWGYNANGKLGDGTTATRSTPTQVDWGNYFSLLSAGNNHTAAIQYSDWWSGSLWTWGYNGYGQLGDGTLTVKTSPIQVGEDYDWSTVSAGGNHTVALKIDGSLWAWGYNAYGQVGDGTLVNKKTPTLVSPESWLAIAAGANFTLAIKDDYTLWAWGYNGNGELGINSTVNSPVPVQIGLDSDWYAIAAGGNHALAEKIDGTLWAWGHNAYGQLGDGTWNNKLSPVQIAGHAGWQSFSAGAYHTLATKNDGTLWVWGFNGDGELGDTAGPTNTLTPFKLDYRGTVVININNGAAYTNNRAVMLTLNVVDKNGVAQMQFSNDGDAWSEIKSYATSANWDLVSDGTKTVYARFGDAAGNWTEAYSASIVLDTVAPAITIISPVSGGTTDNIRPQLTYEISGDAVEMKAFVDEVQDTEVTDVSHDSHTLDALANRSHTVRVEARDAAGNNGMAVANFVVDCQVPQVVITSPSNGSITGRSPRLQYEVTGGSVVVYVDDQEFSMASGEEIPEYYYGRPLEGPHTVRVETTLAPGVVNSATVTFTVDATPPTVTIISPVNGVTNLDALPLVYKVSDGTVSVFLDVQPVNLQSGDLLANLEQNRYYNLTVQAVDAAGNTAASSVRFKIDASAPGNDDTNPYCNGTVNYSVGPSTFASGIITVPAANNDVSISSPYNGETVSGLTTIVKGAMDTTVPVSAVSVLVTNSTGSSRYPALFNGKYFAAKVQLAAGDNTVTATVTDQNNAQHHNSAAIYANTQANSVDLKASPGSGIPTLKQDGKTTLDVGLYSTATTSSPVTRYAWDFTGASINDVTCYSNASVNASYMQKGLYLATVTATDASGAYKDTAIVNVMDRTGMSSIFNEKWNGMKVALAAGNIEGALVYFNEGSRNSFRQQLTRLAPFMTNIVAGMGEFHFVNVVEHVAECDFKSVNNGTTYSFHVMFIRDSNGNWGIRSF